MHSAVNEKLSNQVKCFWDLESIGIVNESKSETAKEKEVHDSFKRTVKYVNGRYSVSLPWNEKKSQLASNKEVAKRRLYYLAQRFTKNQELFDRYKTVVNDQLRDGIAEPVKPEHIKEPIYYIPHQAVIRDDKATTKLRVVFDASSHAIGKPSLNDCLETGPNLVPDLVHVLLNFRHKKYGFMADITKAFLQISVNEEDRNALRFLWFSSDWQPGQELIVDEYRMARVLFGASCSPYLLSATIKHHVNKYKNEYPDIVERIHKQLYVDDFIGSEASEEEVKRIKSITTKIMEEAAMKLTKWSTNSRKLSAEWNVSDVNDAIPVSTDMSSEKVLGITWKREEDVFSYNVRNIVDFVNEKPDTKRNILKTVSRIFDPLGFVSPFSIRVKILFQRLWEKGLEWDGEIDICDANEWSKWKEELPLLENVNVKRCFEVKKVNDFNIHIFCDASESAYGAVAYICMKYVDGSIETNLILSKSRVAPLKKLSLPRLELMGAVVAARLKSYLANIFVNATFHLWTDAMIVLHWIRGSAHKWNPFVSNRVSEIHSLTIPEAWNHCSGKVNPADKLTRGVSIHDLIDDYLWWYGPKWLREESDQWPITRIESVNEDISAEIRKTFVSVATIQDNPFIVDVSNFSTLSRLLRVTAWIKRFISNVRGITTKGRVLTVNELHEAEMYWVREIQQRVYTKEIDALRRRNPLPNESVLGNVNIFVDENGIIRVKGRLEFSDVNEHSKYPIVLPRESHFARLLVVNAHERMKHLGVESTLAEIRAKYHIPRGRQLIKSIIRRCVTCRKLNATSYKEVFAPLPSDRVTPSTPFSVIGMDFAGPLLTRTGKKVYILLITCATTRGVHLEIVEDMSTETTISAFKRFISRRGIPLTIYSDNGTTFKRMNTEIKTLFENVASTSVQDLFSGLRIQWKFIVERSPWWGGFWERMVRTVKSTLKKVLGNASMTAKELANTLIECEAVINDRPLTYTYNDVNEMEPLTPSHLLIGKRISSLPSPIKDVNENSNRPALLTRWEYRQRVIDHFWKRWQKEYLMQLSWPANKLKLSSLTKPKAGEVVLVREDNLVRQQWVMAKIVEVIPGRDNRIRACKVKTPKGSILTRPFQRLYPLEVSSTEGDGTSQVSMGGECCESLTKLPENSGMFSNVRNGNEASARDCSDSYK